MLFVLDNYDSFTYNLVQLFGELGAEPVVYRNDALTVEQVLALKPTAAVLSPGPCTPADAGILVPLVKAWPARCRSWGCAWATRRSARRSAPVWCEPTASCTGRRARSSTKRTSCSRASPVP